MAPRAMLGMALKSERQYTVLLLVSLCHLRCRCRCLRSSDPCVPSMLLSTPLSLEPVLYPWHWLRNYCLLR